MAMTRLLHRLIESGPRPALDALEALLGAGTWSAPESLSSDDCFDHLGSDWRGPARPHDPEDEQ